MRRGQRTLAVVYAMALAAYAAPASARAVLVEAEGFDDIGGWVVDQQCMDQMGSPYLLAHGMGVPVEDATTTVELAPTDIASIITVNEARAQEGLGPITGGEATVAAFRAAAAAASRPASDDPAT